MKITIQNLKALRDEYMKKRQAYIHRGGVSPFKAKFGDCLAARSIDWDALEAEHQARFPNPTPWEERVKEITGHAPRFFRAENPADELHRGGTREEAWARYQEAKAFQEELEAAYEAAISGKKEVFFRGERVVLAVEGMFVYHYIWTLPPECVED